MEELREEDIIELTEEEIKEIENIDTDAGKGDEEDEQE